MIARLVLLAALAASAQTAGPTVTMLKERFVSSVEDADRAATLDLLAKTAPNSGQDVAALFDLFSRDATPAVRQAAMNSLALIPRDSPQLEPIFVNYLNQPEPEAQLFGVNGAFRLRARSALPQIWAIAKRRFTSPTASATAVLSERNAWWTQYEALSVLAQWEGKKTLSLLRSKADESPAVAGLLGRFFWSQTLPELGMWSRSDDAVARQKASEAARAPIPPADARATRDAMLALLKDPLNDEELRHQLALKIGACSDDAEAEALVAEHDRAADERARLLWAAAAFASRSDKVVPLLVRYARQSPDELSRRAALAQLADMLGPDEAKALLEDGKKPDK